MSGPDLEDRLDHLLRSVAAGVALVMWRRSLAEGAVDAWPCRAAGGGLIAVLLAGVVLTRVVLPDATPPRLPRRWRPDRPWAGSPTGSRLGLAAAKATDHRSSASQSWQGAGWEADPPTPAGRGLSPKPAPSPTGWWYGPPLPVQGATGQGPRRREDRPDLERGRPAARRA
jgi:hypothetical protein